MQVTQYLVKNMSREDPQLRIRLPVEVKEKIEISAKANKRSMNAEIVQRLDTSFLKDIHEDDVISAYEAKIIANNARHEISNIIFKRTFNEINKKITLGHTSFYINLNDLELESLADNDYQIIFEKTFNRLNELGYIICENSWDADGFGIEIPE